MAAVVIGVDPSSRTMHAVITREGDKPVLSYIPLHKTDKPKANGQAFLWMKDILRDYRMDDVYVFIEIPVMGRAGAHTMIAIGKAVGSVEAAAVIGGAKVTEVNNMRWKSQVIGGRVGKPEIKQWVKANWPTVYEMADGQQDLCDAACINVYGQRIVGMSSKSLSRKRVVRRKR